MRPAAKRNEALGIIKGGLEDISITRTSTRWGVTVPWDAAPRLLRLVRRARQLPDRHRLRRRRPARFDAWWPAVHHLLGKDIIRFHCVWWPAMCMAAGIDPPAHVLVHGWLAGVGREDVEVGKANQISRRVADRRLRRRRPALPPPARHAARARDGDFSYEGITARYNADLANNLGQPDGPGGHGGRLQVRRRGTGSRSRQPPGGGRAGVVGATPRRRGSACAPHHALEATWRLIRETNAELEATEPWKAEPGPAVDAVLGSALEALAHRGAAGVAGHADTSGRDLAPTRADGRRRGAPAARGHRPGVATPGGRRSRRATPLFPRRRVAVAAGDRPRLDRLALPPPGPATGPRTTTVSEALSRARSAGVSGWCASAPTQRRRARPWRWREAHPAGGPGVRPRFGVWATVGLHPHEASAGVEEVERARSTPLALRRPRRRGGGGGVRARLPLRALAPRRPARRLRRTDRAGAPPRPDPRGPRPRRVGRHPRRARRPTGPRAHGAALLHRWARRGAPLSRLSAAFLSFSGIVTFKNADDVREAAATVSARPSAGRDRRAVPGAGATSGTRQRARVRRVRRRGRCRACAESTRTYFGSPPPRLRPPCLQCEFAAIFQAYFLLVDDSLDLGILTSNGRSQGNDQGE